MKRLQVYFLILKSISTSYIDIFGAITSNKCIFYINIFDISTSDRSTPSIPNISSLCASTTLRSTGLYASTTRINISYIYIPEISTLSTSIFNASILDKYILNTNILKRRSISVISIFDTITLSISTFSTNQPFFKIFTPRKSLSSRRYQSIEEYSDFVLRIR